MAGKAPEAEESIYPRVLVLLRKRLEERGFEDEKRFEGGAKWRGMRPIYQALRDLDWVGVRVAGGKKGGPLVKLKVGQIDQGQPVRMRLWNLELEQFQTLSLQSDAGPGGGYIGEVVSLREEGRWRWAHEVAEKTEARYFENASEAIEWLVEKIAPCVTDAMGLGIIDRGAKTVRLA